MGLTSRPYHATSDRAALLLQSTISNNHLIHPSTPEETRVSHAPPENHILLSFLCKNDQSSPLELGTSVKRRGSRSIAIRRARAKALKDASMM
jgi:hypothetical protein